MHANLQPDGFTFVLRGEKIDGAGQWAPWSLTMRYASASNQDALSDAYFHALSHGEGLARRADYRDIQVTMNPHFEDAVPVFSEDGMLKVAELLKLTTADVHNPRLAGRWIVMIGNPNQGFDTVGPFADVEDAEAWATHNATEDWWVRQLTPNHWTEKGIT